jgi:hypothetical protein
MAVYHFHRRKEQLDIKKLNGTYQIGNGALHARHGFIDGLSLRHFYWNTKNIQEWGSEGRNSIVLSVSRIGTSRFISHRKANIPPIDLSSRKGG